MERINLKEKEVFKKEGRGMANLVDERQALFGQVETLIDGRPEPNFYEVVVSYRI